MKKTRRKLYNAVFRRYFGFTSIIVAVSLIILGILMIVFTASQWWNEKTEALSNNAKIDELEKVVSGYKPVDEEPAAKAAASLSGSFHTTYSSRQRFDIQFFNMHIIFIFK